MLPPRQFFPGIHALRALAATMVVIEHAAFVSNDYSWTDITGPNFSYGRIGVILFFAISGFVIALQRNKPVGVFIAHRLLRIYPSYWLALALAGIGFASVGLPVHVGLSTVLLYPWYESEGGMWIPYWSLAFEVVFYTLAAVAFWLRVSDRTLTILAVLWIAAVNLYWGKPSYDFPFIELLLSPAAQVFPMGLICGIHFTWLRRAGRWPFVAGAIFAWLASVPFVDLSAPKLLMLGASSSCVVLAAADIGSHLQKQIKWAGDASYGIYLLHFPVLMVAAKVFSFGFPMLLSVALICGAAFGRLDHWLYSYLTAPRK